MKYTANLRVQRIGMEACSGSHFLARALREQGHDARLIPAQYVKPYVKTNKSDYIDAEAIAEAVQRPTMRLVPSKPRSSWICDRASSAGALWLQVTIFAPYTSNMDGTKRHQCLIYEGSPSKHLRGLAQVMIAKLQANIRCLYLNSPTMVAGTRSYLAAAGLDVAQEVSKGSLVLSWDAGHLVDGRFEVNRMLGMLSDSVNAALADGYSGLWATGDMTWELGSRKNFEKLLEYEIGLEEMFRSHPALSGICQYPNTTLRILNSNAPERSGCARSIWCAVPWSLHDPSWTGLARSVFYRAGPASSVHAPAASKTPQTATVYSIEHRR